MGGMHPRTVLDPPGPGREDRPRDGAAPSPRARDLLPTGHLDRCLDTAEGLLDKDLQCHRPAHHAGWHFDLDHAQSWAHTTDFTPWPWSERDASPNDLLERCRHVAALNLGSGTDQKPTTLPFETWVNVDIDPDLAPDEVVNLDQRPWPWEEDSFDHVHARDVLEHLQDPLGAMQEIHRITRPHGTVFVQVPHHKSPDYHRDWSHNNGPWSSDRLRWIAQPSDYANGLGFDLVALSCIKPWSFLFNRDLWPKWWRWGRYGNLTATYRVTP